MFEKTKKPKVGICENVSPAGHFCMPKHVTRFAGIEVQKLNHVTVVELENVC